MTDESPDAGTDRRPKTKPVHVWVMFGAILAICGMIISATDGGGLPPAVGSILLALLIPAWVGSGLVVGAYYLVGLLIARRAQHRG